MYAIFKSGCRQYKAAKGDQIKVDFISGKAGDKVNLDQVLMVGGQKPVFGSPTVKGAKVSAVIKEQTFNDKILVFKYKRRKNYKVLNGHKQPMTILEIKDIKA